MVGGGYRLGIDLGTTYVGAALHRDGRSEILSLGADRDVIPSVVYIDPDGNVLVGDAAARRAIAEPDRVARGFKRRVGDSTPIMVGGQPWSAQLLTAELIKSVVHAASEIEGAPPDHVAICHPATWGAHKLEVYDAAATSAGLEERTFLSEPEAAAIFYAAADRIEPGRIVAVYDLGGGTFDATVLRRGDTGFELLGKPIGLDDIGGMDFDDVVYNHVAELLGDRLTTLDDTDPDALAAVEALRERCREAKEALSSETEAVIPIALPTGFTTVRITRAELEAQIRPSIAATVHTLGQVLALAEVKNADVDRILLVGGASRTPLVAEMLSSAMGRPLALDAHPKHSVALGGSRAAGAAATHDAGQLFAAVTSEIAVVAAPVAEAAEPEPEPAATSGAASTGRRSVVYAAAGIAAALVLLIGVLALRPDSKPQRIATGNGGSTSGGSTSGTPQSSNTDSAPPATSIDSNGNVVTIPPSGGGGGGGGGGTQVTTSGGGGVVQSSSTQTSTQASSSSSAQVAPPGAPQSFTVSNPVVLDSQTVRVTLQWSAPSFDGGAPIDGYSIVHTDHYGSGTEIAATPVDVGNVGSTQVNVTIRQLADTGDASVAYVKWRISARNTAGKTGAAAVPNVSTPDVKGSSTDFVYYRLWIVGLEVDTFPPSNCSQAANTVCNQDVSPGTSKPNGTLIKITPQS